MISRVDGTDRRLLLGAAVGLFALFVTLEIVANDEPVPLWDMLFDVAQLAVLVGCTTASAMLGMRLRAQEEESVLLRRDVEIIRARNERWREELAGHLRGLGAAIQAQFRAWGLTPAEQEVGLLLLKGFSHKEIARLRRTSEATIRQQAASLYQKADLSGRAALSAFFLEELLLPDATAAPARPASKPAPKEVVALDSRKLGVG